MRMSELASRYAHYLHRQVNAHSGSGLRAHPQKYQAILAADTLPRPGVISLPGKTGGRARATHQAAATSFVASRKMCRQGVLLR